MTKAKLKKRSENHYTSGNLKKYQTVNPIKKLLVNHMQSKIVELATLCCQTRNPIKILDAGCGEGINAELLLKLLPQARIVLFDASSDALDYAKTICTERCSFKSGSIEKMPFRNGEFEFVLCTEVLEHLHNPDVAVSELIRVSSKYVLISVPHEPWFRIGNLATMKNIRRLGNPHDHVNHWSRVGFQRWIDHNGNGWEKEFSFSFPWLIVLLHRPPEEQV